MNNFVRNQFKKKLRKQEYLQLFTAHNTNWFLCFIRQCILFFSFFTIGRRREKEITIKLCLHSITFIIYALLFNSHRYINYLMQLFSQQRKIYNCSYICVCMRICILTHFSYILFNSENFSL